MLNILSYGGSSFLSRPLPGPGILADLGSSLGNTCHAVNSGQPGHLSDDKSWDCGHVRLPRHTHLHVPGAPATQPASPLHLPLSSALSNFNTHTLKAPCWLLSGICHTEALFSRGSQISRGMILTCFGAFQISCLIQNSPMLVTHLSCVRGRGSKVKRSEAACRVNRQLQGQV